MGQWVGLLAIGISLYILWQIRQVVLLVFAAVVLATVLNRVVKFFQRARISRGLACGFTIVLLLTILVGFFAIILPRMVSQMQQLAYLLPQTLERLRAGYDWLQAMIPGQVLAPDEGLGMILQNLQSWASRLLSNFFFLVTNSVTVVFSVLLFLASTIMLLVNPWPYRRVFVLAFPAFYRRRVEDILDECEQSLVGWMRGTLLAMAAIGFISYIGLLILGVPLPLVNALLAGLLEFIPNIGPTMSVIPPALLSLLDAPWKGVAVIVMYILIQQIESLVLVPFVMEREVSLLPLFTVLSVVTFSLLFGFLGLFLAVPLLIVLQVWLKEVLVEDFLNNWKKAPKNLSPQNPPESLPKS